VREAVRNEGKLDEEYEEENGDGDLYSSRINHPRNPSLRDHEEDSGGYQ